jgi:DNA polymerase III delta prime subunit
MHPNTSEFLWVERWRPERVADCVLPTSLRETFQAFVDQKNIPNLILAGPSGVGKTTVAMAMCKEMGVEYMIINGSEESGIDVLRTKIRYFASTVSLESNIKVVILDEADYLNQNSTQPALRRFMEEYSRVCRFIFTCNYKNRIIKELHSRTTVIDFSITPDEKKLLAMQFYSRVKDILQQENVEYDGKVVAALITHHFPDFRRVLNELQRQAASGKISPAALGNQADARLADLLECVKKKQFNNIRQWVATHVNNDVGPLFRKIYDAFLPKTSQPEELVLILAHYQYMAAFCHDQELNMTACLSQIMKSCTFE